MTIQALMLEVGRAGIIVEPNGDRLRVKAPTGALTAELRESLSARKPELLPVLSRLASMRANEGKAPIPVAVLGATGGPGRCFSCGDALEHPDAYGRCTPCSVASELVYRELPDYAERWRQADHA